MRLFRARDQDRAPFTGAPVPSPDDDPDRGLDLGPDRLLQRRLPGAGFVRLVENPTPTFELPRSVDCRPVGRCVRCAQMRPVWSTGFCDACFGYDVTHLARLNGRRR